MKKVALLLCLLSFGAFAESEFEMVCYSSLGDYFSNGGTDEELVTVNFGEPQAPSYSFCRTREETCVDFDVITE